MEIETHTIRLISHASDFASRKTLINFISKGGSREHGCSLGSLYSTTLSVFDYEDENKKIRINLIDYKMDDVNFEITPDDIIYADVATKGQYTRMSDDDPNIGKINWLNKYSNSKARIFVFERKSYNWSYRVEKIDYNCQRNWIKFICEKYSMKNPIQTTIKLFEQYPKPQPARPTKNNLPAVKIPEVPFPLPKMTISVPRGVKIESVSFNNDKGEVEIIFG